MHRSPGAESRYGHLLAATGAPLHTLDVQKELLADFTGDALADPAFLQALADHNPIKFRSFVTIDWLRSVARKLRGAGFGFSEYFHVGLQRGQDSRDIAKSLEISVGTVYKPRTCRLAGFRWF